MVPYQTFNSRAVNCSPCTVQEPNFRNMWSMSSQAWHTCAHLWLFYTILYYTTLYYAILCYAMLCYAVLCSILYFAMLCYMLCSFHLECKMWQNTGFYKQQQQQQKKKKQDSQWPYQPKWIYTVESSSDI